MFTNSAKKQKRKKLASIHKIQNSVLERQIMSQKISKKEGRMEMERGRFTQSAFFVRMDDNFNWIARIPSTMLGDAQTHFTEKKIDGIDLHIQLSEEFPFKPPQVRILQPKLVCPIVFSGALCLEVLSVFGWSPSMSIDMLLHHIIDQLVIQKPDVKIGLYTEIEAANGRRYIDRVHKKGY